MNSDDTVAHSWLITSPDTRTDYSDIIADVMSMKYSSSTKGMDKFVFSLRNTDLKYKDDPRLRNGITLSVKFGYFGIFSPKKDVVIVGAKPSYDQAPSIELTGYDVGRHLALTAHPRNYGSVSSSEVARILAREFQLRTDIEESDDARSEHRTQPAQLTPYAYLSRLADRLNWDFYIDGGTLHFHAPRMNTTSVPKFVYFLDYRSMLMSFSPEIKTAKAPRVAHSNTNHSRTEAQTGHETNTNRDARSSRYRIQLEPVTGRVVQTQQNVITAPTAETNRRVQSLHTNALKSKISMSAVKAKLETMGIPTLFARDIVNIDGVDHEYLGPWRIVEADHNLSPSGYTSSFSLSRKGLNRGRTRHPANHQANTSSGSDQQQRNAFRIRLEPVTGSVVTLRR